jgi:putative transposase
MHFNPQQHHRRSIRLKEYDYSSPGEYFVTICTKDKHFIFGEIINNEMVLNNYGLIVNHTWNDLINHVADIELDSFVIMPNHIHGIIVIIDHLVGAGSEPAPTMKRHGIPEIVRQLKTFSARRINEIRKTPRTPVWQRNYYEHIIHNEKELNIIRDYIMNNPAEWSQDEENK